VPFSTSNILRVDTTRAFDQPTSWSAFDGKTVHPKGLGFRGAVFDGRYVYFVPKSQSVVLRFEARTPAALPPRYHGSSY
jgi:hypothetical protein